MNTLVIYFSQTGNTLKIARCIHDGISASEAKCEIKPMAEVNSRILTDYDLVGIGAPVFYYKEPFNVRDFIKSLPQLDNQHWFVFCTHGNVIGNFFPSMAEKLKHKGAVLIGCHNCYANITVPFYPKPSYTSGHPDDHDFEQAITFGRDMVRKSLQIRRKGSAEIPAPLPISSGEWIEESHRITKDLINEVMPRLAFNADTCIQCYVCEEQCPVGGINISSNPPRLQNPCIYCWHCVNICPTLSISADWQPLVAAAPANYARYKQELDKAAARGDFRWLIEPKSIDVKNPLYKQREDEIKNKR